MSKHSMNTQELRQRINNLRSMREGLKLIQNETPSLIRAKGDLDSQLQDVRTIYYARVAEARENYWQNMAGLSGL